jgi:hypothetical protein
MTYGARVTPYLAASGSESASEEWRGGQSLKRARQDSNLRPLAPEASALSAELRAREAQFIGCMGTSGASRLGRDLADACFVDENRVGARAGPSNAIRVPETPPAGTISPAQ